MAYDLARKRPYQPTLAAYFNRTRTARLDLVDQDYSSKPLQQARWGLSRGLREINVNEAVQLQGQVQASLLNLGMRIRKAVHDGYRTREKLNTRGELDEAQLSTSETVHSSPSGAASRSKSQLSIVGKHDSGRGMKRKVRPSDGSCLDSKETYEEKEKEKEKEEADEDEAMSGRGDGISKGAMYIEPEVSTPRVIIKPSSRLFPKARLKPNFDFSLVDSEMHLTSYAALTSEHEINHTVQEVEMDDGSDFGEAEFLREEY